MFWPASMAAPAPLIKVWATSVVGFWASAGIVMEGSPLSARVTTGRPAGGATAWPEARAGTSRASSTSMTMTMAAYASASAVASPPGAAITIRTPIRWSFSTSLSTPITLGSPTVSGSGASVSQVDVSLLPSSPLTIRYCTDIDWPSTRTAPVPSTSTRATGVLTSKGWSKVTVGAAPSGPSMVTAASAAMSASVGSAAAGLSVSWVGEAVGSAAGAGSAEQPASSRLVAIATVSRAGRRTAVSFGVGVPSLTAAGARRARTGDDATSCSCVPTEGCRPRKGENGRMSAHAPALPSDAASPGARPARVGVVGSGWRAEFYLRMARLMPARSRITGVVTRTAERGDQVRAAWGVPTVRTVADLLALERPDYVVVAVPWDVTPVATGELVRSGVSARTG